MKNLFRLTGFMLLLAVFSYSANGQTRIKAKQIGGGNNGQIIMSDGTNGGWADAPYISWTDTLDDGSKQIVTLYKLTNTLDNTNQFIRTESDPTVPSHVKNITTTDESNWDAAYNDKINSASFASGTGILTLTQQDNGTVTVNLDGRYLTISDANNDYVKKTTSVNLGSGLSGSSDLSSNLNVNLDFSYLDNRYLSGFKQKTPVVVATGSNITLSGLQTIDGVTLQSGDRVLVMNQTNAADNGIYAAASGSWSRTTDFDEAKIGEVEQGASTFVQEGADYGNTSWTLQTGGTIVIGTTDLTFIQSAGSASYQAGDGLELTGTTFKVDNSIARTSQINAQDLKSVLSKGNASSLEINLLKYVENNTVSNRLNFGISSGKKYGIESYRAATSNMGGLRITTYNGGANTAMDFGFDGKITIPDLAGSGTRFVAADANGTLTTQTVGGTDITASLDNSDVLSINSSTGSDATVDMTGLNSFYKVRKIPDNTDLDNFQELGTGLLSTSNTGITHTPDWYTTGERTIISQLGKPGAYMLQLGVSADNNRYSFRTSIAAQSWGSWVELAQKNDIPTSNSDLANGEGYLKSVSLTTSLSGNTLTVSNNAGGSDNVDLSSIAPSTPCGNITGTQDIIQGTGTNSVTLSHTPSSCVMPVVSYNGVVQKAGSGYDYTITGTTVTFTFTIESTDNVIVNYSY